MRQCVKHIFIKYFIKQSFKDCFLNTLGFLIIWKSLTCLALLRLSPCNSPKQYIQLPYSFYARSVLAH